MVNDRDALKCYREGLEELLYVSPTFGAVARAMGSPVWDETQSTAYVTYDTDGERIVFAMNPEFIQTLSMESVAGVIAHETHHVVLAHLRELTDPLYPNRDALTKAQECIINDTVEGTFQLPLPDFVMRGMDLAGQDCSHLSTLEAYRLFDQEQESGSSESSEGEGAGESDEQAVSGNSQASQDSGACGGILVPAGYEGEAAKAIGAIIGEAADAMGISPEELEQKITQSTPGGYNPSGAPAFAEAAISNERMNWRLLLARINPKVMDSGKKRAKSRNNWTRYNRRMTAVYPKAILPVSERVKPKPDDDGDELPVLVVALDQSGSIPRALVKTLQGLIQEIPEELIRAYPCTWGSNLVPFVPGGRVAGASGTNISNVVAYVEKIKKETGVDPYVLVISDGEFTRHHSKPGKQWFWMGVNRSSVNTFRRGKYGYGGQAQANEEVYCVDDFKV